MRTYVIYEIPESKVGCTVDFAERQKRYPKGTVFKILEKIRGTAQKASLRERYWQGKLGYPIDRTPYTNNWNFVLTKKQRREYARLGGRAGRGRKGREITAWTNGDAGRASARSRNHISKRQVKCPHCKLTGMYANMKRYHFDNCKILKRA